MDFLINFNLDSYKMTLFNLNLHPQIIITLLDKSKIFIYFTDFRKDYRIKL